MTNTHRYQAIIETIRQGSLTKAAKRLGYTQSGITHLLTHIENDFGLKVIDRNKKGARLTPEGEILLPYLHAVLQAEEALHDQVNKIKGIETGTIRVGSFSSISTTFLPKLVKQFGEVHPGITFEVLHGDYTQIETYLLEGFVDIGFLRGPIKPAFSGEVFYSDEVVALVPASHPLATTPISDLTHFEKEPFIMLEADSDNDYKHYLERNNINPTIIYSAPEDSAVMALIEQGLGIGLGYELSLHANSFDIVGIPLRVPFPRTIYWTYKTGVHPTPASAMFISFLQTLRAEDLI